MKRILSYLIILGMPFQLMAQSEPSAVMTYEEYMLIIKNHHPVAMQAQNQIDLSKAYLLKSKGGFDPVLLGGINQKYFKGDQYYNIINSGLKIPTWYGISFQGGYDLTNGSQLNPERVLPDDGLWYAGVNVSLGKGLIIDQRRSEYKKAKIFLESSIQGQINMMNELYLQSSLAYWDWFKARNKMLVYQEAVDNALERFEGVKRSAQLGDRPFIDTLEASIQVQNRYFNFLEAQMDYANATALLEIFLWEDGFQPLELDASLAPPKSTEVAFKNIDPQLLLTIDSLKINHPELLNTQYKIDQLNVDLKLSRENLKPELNFKYNALTYGGINGLEGNYSPNNYTWGADIKFPLVFRKERGNLKINKIEIENMQADLAFKTEQISYKVNQTINEWTTSFQQLKIWQNTTRDYFSLLEAEKVLFNIGESSLFMVNSREQSYINARLNFIDKISENRKSEIKAQFALGIIYSKFKLW